MAREPEPSDDPAVGSTVPTGDDVVVGEARWPMAGAVVAAIVLTILLPAPLRLGPRWLLPLIEVVLLIAVIFADPAGSPAVRGSSGHSRSRSSSS
jgi:hypothetical protein